ncbi:helix-turn-helix transcriptional regulator [Nocardioides sp.]|uniref:helix-turn-helix transcriptional regulator n=1 Tax=Nocardioides sp. TaxID=35761 RepID=UPI001996DD64|nr:helix-turn-helix transcriptional regulator [Nocardioides sp.]MBC7275513.1 helix-turn-helix domain-containing protein [Nocardioides sp.]
MTATTLGSFLRARRAAASPESLPLPTSGARRVPGLRRDEVALMAGVSVDYYTRLEQGREDSPSQQVVDALARALQLTSHQTEHLYDLANLRWEPLGGAPQQVDPALLTMMESWERSAAFVLDPLLDIVAMNRTAAALFAPFRNTSNLVEMVFLHPLGREFYADWDRAAESCVAALRATARLSASPERHRELMDNLLADADFAALWEAYDVEPKTRDEKVLVHVVGGEMTINFLTFHVAHQPGFELVVYQAAPGSVSERRLLGLAEHLPPQEAAALDEASAGDAG